ncbi:hypothetical protein TWF718_004123 [Orbilia javanica]|uniref:Uncharacterized protein n=1 Tax=Orbilia javanica TaxID=47235 RepID=A0AAN8MRT3_9PEZI
MEQTRRPALALRLQPKKHETSLVQISHTKFQNMSEFAQTPLRQKHASAPGPAQATPSVMLVHGWWTPLRPNPSKMRLPRFSYPGTRPCHFESTGVFLATPPQCSPAMPKVPNHAVDKLNHQNYNQPPRRRKLSFRGSRDRQQATTLS